MEKMSSDLDDFWGAGLPCDLSRCIGDRLDDLARICFRAVCRSWRAALPAGRLISIPSPVVVIPAIPADYCSLTFPLVRSVVDSCGSTASSPTAALPLHVVDDSKLRCVGSSGGWLAVADSGSVIRLVNALTLQEAACLPPLPRSARVSTSSTPEYLDHYRHEHTIHKVAFSVKPPRARGSSYAHSAAALHRATGLGHGLALTFTRAGWDHWMWRQPVTTYVPYLFGDDGDFDVAYCERFGVYYVVTPNASVWVLDMSAPVPTLEPFQRCHARPSHFAGRSRKHIVVLSEDDDDDGALSHMYMVIVMEDQQRQHAIVQEYTAGMPWEVVSDLRGRALLIARRAHSMSVLPMPSSPPWLRPDCIYWMTEHDDDDEEWYHDGCEIEQEMMSPVSVWRFHVPTNTTDRFFKEERAVGADYSLDWDNSLWLTPSLT